MKNKVIIISAAIVLLALLAGGGYYIWRQQQTIDELTEGFALEKEQLEDEYTQLAIQYEGYKLQEIAQILKTKPATVGTWLDRGRQALKLEMEANV